MFRKLILNALKEKTLIGFRTFYQEWDEEFIGFVSKCDNGKLSVDEIDEYGQKTGCLTINIDDIVSMNIDDRYLKRLNFLNKSFNKHISSDKITFYGDNIELINYLKMKDMNGLIITFLFEDNFYVTGKFVEIDNYHIKIENIGNEGDNDGHSIHLVKNLIGIEYNGLKEQKIKLLYENAKLFYI